MTGLRFELDAAARLSLVYEPGPDTPVDQAAVAAALQRSGHGACHVDDNLLSDALRRVREDPATPLTAVVGEQRDGSYQLVVSDDLMQVWLTLVPPCGGKAVGAEVQDELRRRGIVHGVLAGRLQAALIDGKCDMLLIAQGQPPEDGVPARFENLLPDVKERRPQVDRNGIVDYRNLGQIQIVHPHDPLLRRIPAIPGKNGINVRGEVVLAQAMPMVEFARECAGVEPAAADPNILEASITGQPVRIDNGFIVNPIIEVPDVDLQTGNILFEGTVKVLGDVKPGMRIEAGGDVLVSGMVEGAEIVAGGDVTIKGGVVGQLAARQGGERPQSNAVVRARGSVSVLFAESAEIRSRQSILINDYANQCNLMAHQEIVVGKSGGRRGALIGGYASALMRLKADVLGAVSGVATRVQVGLDPYSVEQQHGLTRQIATVEAEMQRIDQLLDFFVQNPKKGEGGLQEKAQRSRALKQQELERLQAELASLLADDEQALQASVEVRRAVHGGVDIRIGMRLWQVIEDRGPCTLRLHENEIIAA